MKLNGNKVLITGGSSGIGLGIAREFLVRGNEVIVTGRNEEKLKKVKTENPGIETIACDISSVEDILSLAENLHNNHPDLNFLINNAGVFEFKNLQKQTNKLEKITEEIDINFSGPIRTTAALIDLLVRNKGAIMNVSSGLAYVPLMAAPVYCATKAAIHSYTVSLRFQMQEHGVEVIELMPPAVRTEMTQDLPDDAGFPIWLIKCLEQEVDRSIIGYTQDNSCHQVFPSGFSAPRKS